MKPSWIEDEESEDETRHEVWISIGASIAYQVRSKERIGAAGQTPKVQVVYLVSSQGDSTNNVQ